MTNRNLLRHILYAVGCLLLTGCYGLGEPDLAPTGPAQASITPERDLITANIDQTPTMAITRIIASLPAGQSLGDYHLSLMCSGPYGPIYWNDLRPKIRNSQIRLAVQRALEQAGYRSMDDDNEDLFQNWWQRNAQWLIAARVKTINANLCRDSNWLTGTKSRNVSGSVDISVAWQVFDTNRQETVLRGESSGHSTLETGTSDGISALMERAFADAFDQFGQKYIDPALTDITARQTPLASDAFNAASEEPEHLRQMSRMPENDDPSWQDDDEDDPETAQADRLDVGMPGLMPVAPAPSVIRTSLHEGAPVTADAPTPWQDQVTDHPDKLLGGILRLDISRQPILALRQQNGTVIGLTINTPPRTASRDTVSLQALREDGTSLPTRKLAQRRGASLLLMTGTVSDLVPIAEQSPRTGSAIALISSVKGKARLEPILTSGLVARVTGSGQDKTLWLDIPRKNRNRPMLVLDDKGNLAAMTMPDPVGSTRDGLVPAVPISKNILQDIPMTGHAALN